MSCQFACLCHVRVTDLASRGKQYLGPKGCALLRSADGSRFSLLLYAPVTKKHDFHFNIESDPDRFQLNLEDAKVANFEFQQQSFQLTFTSTEEFWKFCRNLALARAAIALQRLPAHEPQLLQPTVLSAQTLYAGSPEAEDSLAATAGCSVKLRWELFAVDGGLAANAAKAPDVGQLVASSTSRRFPIPAGPAAGASLQTLAPVVASGLRKRGRRVILLSGLTADQAAAWGSQVPSHRPLLLEVICGTVKPAAAGTTASATIGEPAMEAAAVTAGHHQSALPPPPAPPHPAPELATAEEDPIAAGSGGGVDGWAVESGADEDDSSGSGNSGGSGNSSGSGGSAAETPAVPASAVSAAYEQGRQDVIELAKQRIAEIKAAAQSRFEELEAMVEAERLEKEAILAQSKTFCGQVLTEQAPSLATELLQTSLRGLLTNLRSQVDSNALYDGGQLQDLVRQAVVAAAWQALRSHRLEARLDSLSAELPDTTAEKPSLNSSSPPAPAAAAVVEPSNPASATGPSLPSFIDHL